MDEVRPTLDEEVRAACAQQKFQRAATLALGALGADVLRVIHARFLREDQSAEVFSMFTEDLWRGLPAFAFRCSLRAWCFMLARNAGSRFLDRELRHARRQVPLSQCPELAAFADALRTKTLPGITTSATRLQSLRSELSEGDQLLLTLRLDRELDFGEIAIVTLGDEQAGADDVQREAARLRKRFQLIKERLRRRWST